MKTLLRTIAIAALIATAASGGVVTVERINETIMRESGGDPRAVGLAGEVGLGQLKPGAVQDLQKHFGWRVTGKDRWCPKLNRVMTEGYLLLTERRLEKRLKRPPTWEEVELAYINGVDGFFRLYRHGSAGVAGRGVPRDGDKRT